MVNEDCVIRLTTPVSSKKFHIPKQASQGRRSTERERVEAVIPNTVFVVIFTCVVWGFGVSSDIGPERFRRWHAAIM
jgi:hypothetical protein